jgi:hypothetical protein
MSATQTVQAIVEWAMAQPSFASAPPAGDLLLLDQLAKPPEALCQLLGQLTAVTTARLRFSSPPLGDDGSVSLGALLIAAAIGTAQIPELAQLLLTAVPDSTSPVEWVARHGVVEPALRFLPEPVADDCRLVSPLTALLDRPVASQTAAALEVATKLIARPVERLALTLHLAKPTSNDEVRNWRQMVLDRLRLHNDVGRDFVLDVYEAMMVHHEQEALAQVRAARALVTNPLVKHEDASLYSALSAANWWRPLWALERADISLLRARRYLGYSYREGIALFKLCQRLVGEVSIDGGIS